MKWVVVALGGTLATQGTARADQADDLVVAGQQAAAAGKFDEAIAKFRDAENARPSALHDCLIGLAQLRAGRLDAAELEFAACRRRATAKDPVPAWLPPEERRLADQRDATHPKPAQSSRGAKLLLASGAGLAVAGAALHLAIVRPARNDLAAAATGADYDARYGRYNAARIATIGLYALGGVAVAVGLVTYPRSSGATIVGARAVDGGGLITLEWRR